MNLNKKLGLLVAGIMLPLILLTIYLIVSLVYVGDAYDKVVKNITTASEYNRNFKKEIDYIVYSSVINLKTYDELVEQENQNHNDYVGDHYISPYQTINKGRASFTMLLENAEKENNEKNIRDLNWIIKSINRLEEVVRQLDENIRSRASYRENSKLLENGVMILTDTIQKDIQIYIQEEAVALEEVRQGIEKKKEQAVTVSIYGLIIIFGASLFIARKITLSVTRPIKELCEATDQVARGDFSSPTVIKADDEIQVLNNSFNDMKVKIGRLIEDVKSEQTNLRATELRLLQAQINPHFLYNTLDAIIWLAESGQNEAVVDMVTSLSEFFRTTLSKGKDTVSVQEEVSHIQSYLNIQQFRYQDILEYAIDVEEELYRCKILKLTLQPIVENALYHGIKNKRGRGKITVLGRREGREMVFQVIDNGIGLSEEELENLRKSLSDRKNGEGEGFGLSNVNERIVLTYGADYGLFFESRKGEGTAVTVRLPFQ